MEPKKAITFAELYRNHAREVYRFALFLTADPALAEDIVADVFLRVWDSSTPVRMDTVRGYLFAIARNLFLRELRRTRQHSPLEDRYGIAATAARELESREDLRDTLAALQTLPEIDRTALLLRAHEGLPYEEIARVLGLSVSAVKVKIHRARLRLAERKNEAERRKGAVRANN